MVFLLIFSITLYAQSHSLFSSDEIVSLTDPAAGTRFEPDIDGSLILSWDEGVLGVGGGFCDLTAYTPFPNGGKYEISLLFVTASNANQIQGFWQVKKNNVVVAAMIGSATNLNATVGGQITIIIDGIIIIIRISFRVDGLLAPNTIDGQQYVDGSPLVGATARLRGGGMVLDEQLTDFMGEYHFVIDPTTVNKILIIFKNFDPNIVIKGYVYVAGEPLVGAPVLIENQAGTLAMLVTNGDGYYQSPPILGAVGPGQNQIKTTIDK